MTLNYFAATRPPTPTSKPSLRTDEIVAISVGSVAGALILLALFILCLHYRSKRRERKSAVYLEETPMEERPSSSGRSSVMSKPPAYTSSPATPAPTVAQAKSTGFKSAGFDEDISERL